MVRQECKVPIIHPLTQIVLSVLWLPQLSLQRRQAFFTVLYEAYTFHVRHAISLNVVYSIREIHLMRKKYRLCRS